MARTRRDDDTVIVARPSRAPWRGIVAALVLGLLGAGGWLALRQPPAPAPVAITPEPAAPVASAPAAPAAPAVPAPAIAPSPPPPPAPAAFAFQTADEAAILAHDSGELTVFRLAASPGIVVLDFPSLQPQGEMLNRVAALVEKSGLPRDRVLNDAELAEAIRARGDTTASFYSGHDYPAAALVRFFSLADRDHVALDPAEEQLRGLLRQLDWFTPGHIGALISLSRANADADITPSARATILHHELSHGAFFTDANYAAYVRGFWRDKLTARERDAFREFLAGDGYDKTDEELMLNEMQAYLMFTHDPGYFDPTMLGMPLARRAQLEALFRHDMPDFWLRAMPGSVAPAATPAPTPAVSGAAPAARAAPAAPTSSAACGPAARCR